MNWKGSVSCRSPRLPGSRYATHALVDKRIIIFRIFAHFELRENNLGVFTSGEQAGLGQDEARTSTRKRCADKSTPAWRSAHPWPSTISLDSNNQTSFKAVQAHAADEPTHSTRLSRSWPSRAAQAMPHQAQAYIIRVLEESEQRPSFDLRGAKIVLGSPRQKHKVGTA